MAKGFKLLDAYVAVSGDGTKIVDDVVKDMDNDGGKVEGAGRGIGRKLVGGITKIVSVYAIGRFIGESIMQASDLNETMSASTVIFGEQADAIDRWSDTSATAFGLSKQAATDAATSFGDMFLQLGFAGDQAAQMSTDTVQLAADLGSFKNLPTSTVLDMISASLRGEYDSLQRVIPNINAARVEKEALAMTGKTLASELTAQEKAQATLNVINEDGARASGDFARTQDGLANQMKIAQAQTADLQAELGTALMPVLGELAGWVTDNVLPAIKGFAEWIGKNTEFIGPLVIILGALAAAIWIVNVAMYANPIGLIIAAVVLLIGLIVALVMNWDTVVKFITDVWQGFVNWFVEVMTGFANWWNEVWAGFIGFVTDVWNGFVAWFTEVALGFVNWYIGLWVGLFSTVNDLWTGFVGWITDGFNALLAGLRFIGGMLASWWNGLWAGLAGFVGDAFKNIGNFIIGVLNTVIGLVNGALSGINDMGAAARQITGGAIGWDIGSLPTIPGLATGGKVLEGGLVKVGERGAEILRLPAGAEVSTLTSAKPSDDNVTYIHIDNVNLLPGDLEDVQKALKTLRELAQVARQGRGKTTMQGTVAA